MKTELTYLTEMLERDIAENGNRPLTTQSLLNLINLAFEKEADDEERIMESLNDIW